MKQKGMLKQNSNSSSTRQLDQAAISISSISLDDNASVPHVFGETSFKNQI
jgi:hypothetical protein